jgi:ArsR family transcriptional regulator
MKTLPAIPIHERLAAISDPVRLRLLRLLEVQELSVGEVGRVVQLPQSTVSRHLKALGDTGWVARRSEGPASLYRLTQDDLSPEARALWLAIREQASSAGEREEDDRRVRAVLAERKIDSQAFFGRLGAEWDQVRTDLFGGRFAGMALLAMLRKDWTIADLGCGTGNTSEMLAPFVERVVAVDVSDAMISAARARLSGKGSVEIVRAPVEQTGLPTASCDAVACMLVLHHTEDPGAVLREAARLLRTDRGGGMLVVVDMVAHEREDYRRTMGHRHLGFSSEAIASMMQSAGLGEVRRIELPREGEARGPGLFVAWGKRREFVNGES